MFALIYVDYVTSMTLCPDISLSFDFFFENSGGVVRRMIITSAAIFLVGVNLLILLSDLRSK